LTSQAREAVLPARHAVLRDIGRTAYRQFTAMTASLRMEPGFLMIGASRCGTTSMFEALAAHPQAIRPLRHKGIYYFDLNYYRGQAWYRGHFPTDRAARRRAASYGEPVAFEASGYYIFHPFALGRVAQDLPAVKLLVMLRDPVERAHSAYKHERARGFEHVESFEEALEIEDARLAREIERIRLDPRYEGFSHRHHSYRHRGHYAEQLERVFALFPRSQVLIIESEAYFSQPAREYRRVLEFLGLRPFEPSAFTRPKSHPGPPMAASTANSLRRYYASHDERLASLLGRPVHWVDTG
jgi:Sulfotransferase domain